MKMTPEQKAFFEYGKALGRLEEFRKNYQNHPCVQNLTMRHFWRTAQVCCGQKTITNRHAELILDAWKKRAACRAWAHPMRRRCSNCKHHAVTVIGDPCFSCTPPNGSINNWEPRKEGE